MLYANPGTEIILVKYPAGVRGREVPARRKPVAAIRECVPGFYPTPSVETFDGPEGEDGGGVVTRLKVERVSPAGPSRRNTP